MYISISAPGMEGEKSHPTPLHNTVQYTGGPAPGFTLVSSNYIGENRNNSCTAAAASRRREGNWISQHV
jgi:hypothetical protein